VEIADEQFDDILAALWAAIAETKKKQDRDVRPASHAPAVQE